MSVLINKKKVEVHYRCRWCNETFVGKVLEYETLGAAQLEITRMQIHLNNLGDTPDLGHKSIILHHTTKGTHQGIADIIGYKIV